MGTLHVRVLLDSVILIDHFNGINEATDFLLTTRTDALISVITRAEVLTGFDSEDETAAARSVLDLYQTLSIDSAVADLAATLRHDYRWKLPDAFQAALASHHDLCLATRNTRDFSPSEHEFVLIPYELGR